MYLHRSLEPLLRQSRKSFLLLGPRQTGKSTLVRSLEPQLAIDLVDEETYVSFLRDPGLLRNSIGKAKTVAIDEVQRIPSLLNTVQSLVDRDPTLRFYLTGSSARKLKRGRANLLPGRIFTYELGPLSLREAGDAWNLESALRKGMLPGVFLEPDESVWTKLLRTYAITYLKEEVQAEALTRNLEGFSRFFDVVVSRSGDWIDFTKFSSAASIERMSARRYFDVLVDTLLVTPVDAFSKSSRRRLVQHPRYYLFDVGVLNGALRNFEASADRRGKLLEHLFLQLLLSDAKSRDKELRVTTYRTEAGAEVDFIVESGKSVCAIEVKASRNVGPSDLRGLKSFADYYGRKKSFTAVVAYLGSRELEMDGISILPIERALGVVA